MSAPSRCFYFKDRCPWTLILHYLNILHVICTSNLKLPCSDRISKPRVLCQISGPRLPRLLACRPFNSPHLVVDGCDARDASRGPRVHQNAGASPHSLYYRIGTHCVHFDRELAFRNVDHFVITISMAVFSSI